MRLFSSSSSRLVSGEDIPAGALDEFLGKHRVSSVFVAEHVGKCRAVSLTQAPPVIGVGRSKNGASSGRRSLGFELHGACWVGNNVVPVALDETAVGLVAEYLLASRVSRSSFFGPQREVLGLWNSVKNRWAEPFAVRDDQPLLTVSAGCDFAPDPELRLATVEDFSLVLPASTQMFTEEVGYVPDLSSDSSYVRRVAQLIEEKRTYVVVRDGGVVFKADIGVAAGGVCQVQGVWVAPEFRGRNLSGPFMAAVVDAAKRRWPTVSLYVNSYNIPALRSYHRVGFRQVGTFATVLL